MYLQSPRTPSSSSLLLVSHWNGTGRGGAGTDHRAEQSRREGRGGEGRVGSTTMSAPEPMAPTPPPTAGGKGRPKKSSREEGSEGFREAAGSEEGCSGSRCEKCKDLGRGLPTEAGGPPGMDAVPPSEALSQEEFRAVLNDIELGLILGSNGKGEGKVRKKEVDKSGGIDREEREYSHSLSVCALSSFRWPSKSRRNSCGPFWAQIGKSSSRKFSIEIGCPCLLGERQSVHPGK
jgi:hypothetical protein